jgi:hypothetical protein
MAAAEALVTCRIRIFSIIEQFNIKLGFFPMQHNVLRPHPQYPQGSHDKFLATEALKWDILRPVSFLGYFNITVSLLRTWMLQSL